MSINERFKEARKFLNLDQKTLAKELDVSQRDVSRYESGDAKNIPNSVIQKMNTDYNINLNWLLSGTGNMCLHEEQKDIKPNLNDISQRFIESVGYLKEKGIVKSNAVIARKINVSSSLITEVIKGRTNIRPDKLMKFSEIFHINIDWLETGEGEMFIKKYNNITDKEHKAEPSREYGKNKEVERLKESLQDKIKIIESLNEIIDLKNVIINNLKSELERLSPDKYNKQTG